MHLRHTHVPLPQSDTLSIVAEELSRAASGSSSSQQRLPLSSVERAQSAMLPSEGFAFDQRVRASLYEGLVRLSRRQCPMQVHAPHSSWSWCGAENSGTLQASAHRGASSVERAPSGLQDQNFLFCISSPVSLIEQ